jgi:hypothetical protein
MNIHLIQLPLGNETSPKMGLGQTEPACLKFELGFANTMPTCSRWITTEVMRAGWDKSQLTLNLLVRDIAWKVGRRNPKNSGPS